MNTEIDELIEVENYLLAKSAEKLGTPVKMELDKLRQVAEERAVNCNKGLAGVLGISNTSAVFSSPLAQIRSPSSVLSAGAPMSEISFKPGMSVYRPGGSKTEHHCPPTPSFNEGKRSRLSSRSESSKELSMSEPEELIFNENCDLSNTTLISASVKPTMIPFSPSSRNGINLIERESDPKKLASRQKQIDYGKNTAGYALYTAQVPRNQRKRGDHPWTPNKYQLCSKRSWDGQVRKWRRALHKFDPNEPSCDDSIESESVVSEESEGKQ